MSKLGGATRVGDQQQAQGLALTESQGNSNLFT